MIKPKKCKECGNSFNPKYSTLENSCSQECKVKLNNKKSNVQNMHNSKKISIKKHKLIVKTCKICKSKFTPKNVSTEKVCQEYQCKVTYALEVVKKQKIVKEKKQRQDNLAKKRILRDKVTKWHDVLQKEVNKIVRSIDKGLPCLARNINGQIHAGHVYARGGNPTIRYNLHNIHRQCAQSNHFQNDDGLLREGLIKEYGLEYMEFINSIRQTPQLKYKQLEYKELALKARKIALNLKKQDLIYSILERINLRNEINIKLGIYSEDYCVFNWKC